MPIRLIAIDLDGTLLNSSNEISGENTQALTAAHQAGAEVVVVTGRRFHSARPFVEQIPFPVTVISSNGARIGSTAGEVHYRNFLPAEMARRVLELAIKFRPYAVAIFDRPGAGQVMMQVGASHQGPLAWYLRNNPDCLGLVPDLHAAIAEDPVHVTFGGPPSTLEPLEAALRQSPCAAEVHLTWTKYLTRNVSLLDVMNRGCSKGSALAFWSAHQSIPSHDVMAIGDNHNDLEMLEFAGCGVMMANCSADLNDGRWLRTFSNDQHGVAEAIRRYVFQ
ncbi:MAG TPA: Cof-type HAD-IIB family hydrolase [Terriglobia bacterium]|nr:Cof-type HAD-IIB family hydrolase [Terriglobia bacterium]